jgi:hypothetical protein
VGKKKKEISPFLFFFIFPLCIYEIKNKDRKNNNKNNNTHKMIKNWQINKVGASILFKMYIVGEMLGKIAKKM